MSDLRIHPSALGLDVARLKRGSDLVLQLSEREAVVAAAFVYAADHLVPKDKLEIDGAAARVLAEWRQWADPALTIDGVQLGFALERELLASVVLPTLRAVRATSRAVQRWSPERLEVRCNGPLAEALIETARAARPEVTIVVRTEAADPLLATVPAQDRRIKTRALDAITTHGLPTRLRRGSTVLIGYWMMAGVVDALLRSPRHLPAAVLNARPPGLRRTLAAAKQGGWVGGANRGAVERAEQDVATAMSELGEPPRIEAFGVDVGPAIHAGAAALVTHRGGGDLGSARTMRDALRRRVPSSVVVPFDSTPLTRVLIGAARELDVRSIAIAHGGYWFPAIVQDLEVADEIAVWSPQVLEHIAVRGRPVHLVGYPRGREPRRAQRTRSSRRLRVVVLEQPQLPLSAAVDARMSGYHYRTALRAIARLAPQARVVLRPHPSRGHPTAELVRALHTEQQVEVAVGPTILEVLRDADLCIGSASTATLEAAYAGVPVVVLDLTEIEWPWPLGGETDVPIARSEDELVDAIRSVLTSGSFLGRETLLTALGADPGAPVTPYEDIVPPARR